MPALPMARPSAFERRIAAMLNPRLDRRPLSLRAVATLAMLLAGVTVGAASARARQAPADMSGTVYDPSGGIIPGVTLTLSAPRQRTVSSSAGALTVTEPAPAGVQATTDSAGRFSFPGIAPGRYVLTAALPGFHELREEFDLKATSDWDRVVTLQIGTLRETINVSATRTFAAPAAGPAPIRVGGNIRVPLKLHDVKPVYPESMRAEGREAEVQLEATIDREGAVSALRVLSSQIHPDFALAASDAVRQWRFRPTLLNGKPIDVVMTVTVRFSLSD
jgi:TonB family protein